MIIAGAGLVMRAYKIKSQSAKNAGSDDYNVKKRNSLYLGFGGIAIGGIGAVILGTSFSK